MRRDSSTQRFLLIGTAVFAMAWVIARAYLQAVAMDEAVTYMNFVKLPGYAVWSPHANNHVLNSMLMRVFTSMFGLSPLTVRSGALIGAALYIAAVYRLCRMIAPGLVLQWPLFVCLVFNPFILDFLVAARGYGLASALLLTAIVVVASFELRSAGHHDLKLAVMVCVGASVSVGLSFTANFSFAFVDAATVVMLYLWVCGWSPAVARQQWPHRAYVQLALACVLPGVVVAAAVAGPMLVHFPKDELVAGADSFGETLRSLYQASYFEVNPHFGSALHSTTHRFGLVLALTGIVCAIRVGLMFANRHPTDDRYAGGLRAFAFAMAGVLTVTILAHWLAFSVGHVLWPKDRTAIYFVVLLTLLVGILASVPVPTRWGRISRSGLTVTLSALAIYFLLCLRIGYFKEWKFDADIDKVYSILASYNHSCGAKTVPANWRYDASLNFYRTLSGREDFTPFPPGFGAGFAEYPGDKSVYALYSPEDEDFIEKHGLWVVYRSELGSMVAIDTAVCDAPKIR